MVGCAAILIGRIWETRARERSIAEWNLQDHQDTLDRLRAQTTEIDDSLQRMELLQMAKGLEADLPVLRSEVGRRSSISSSMNVLVQSRDRASLAAAIGLVLGMIGLTAFKSRT